MQTLTDAVLVTRDARLNFLPTLFSDDYLRAEMNIYQYADRYIQDYDGAEWLFYTLPEGGGYLAPDVERVKVWNPDNWFEQEMSADAAGIFITAMVLNHRCWMYSHHDEEELCGHFLERYEQLMAFIETHPERNLILRALD
ncbi:TPA: antirestriction protein [Salmonella enterica subsp. enterica serovar Derby]|jgi:hypothetical protein